MICAGAKGLVIMVLPGAPRAPQSCALPPLIYTMGMLSSATVGEFCRRATVREEAGPRSAPRAMPMSVCGRPAESERFLRSRRTGSGASVCPACLMRPFARPLACMEIADQVHPARGGALLRGCGGATSKEVAMRQPDLFRTPKKPWNAGRIIGPRAPLKPKHIWAIRQQLKVSGRRWDLAMFNCAIDAKLRACDLVRLTVSDVAPGGVLRARSTVIQQKTGRPAPFEITEPTREALASWLALRGRRADDWLFPSRSRHGDHITTRRYARLIDRWVQLVDLEPGTYGTHSLHRTKGHSAPIPRQGRQGRQLTTSVVLRRGSHEISPASALCEIHDESGSSRRRPTPHLHPRSRAASRSYPCVPCRDRCAASTRGRCTARAARRWLALRRRRFSRHVVGPGAARPRCSRSLT